MNKTTNKYSPEVRERAVRMVLDNQGQHDSRWSAILSISSKIGCAPQTLNEWVKKFEVDMQPLNGWTGSTTADCWSLSEISHQPKPRQTSMQLWKDQTWPRN